MENENNTNTTPSDTGSDEQEIKSLFGITSDMETDDAEHTEETEPVTTPAESNPAPESKDQGSTNPNTNPDNTPPEPVESSEKKPTNKANQAFAEMRTKNKALESLILDLAKATGQPFSNVEEAQAIIKGNLTKITAKNKNIPEEVQQEIEQQRQELEQLKQQQASQKALSGFQQVKDTYGLSKEEVEAFADKLVTNHIDPFKTDVDLLKEYRNLYFEDIISKAVEKGVQEERARALKAQNNSTTPSNKTGSTAPENTPKNISSIADLDTLLDGLK